MTDYDNEEAMQCLREKREYEAQEAYIESQQEHHLGFVDLPVDEFCDYVDELVK